MKNTHRQRLFALLVSGGLSMSLLPGLPVLAQEETWIGAEDLSDVSVEAPAKDEVLPDANQYRYQKAELAAFCHFGPNTFNEVERGENYGSQAPSAIFRLTEDFDEETYVRTLKDAGFTKLIVTAKHHDGFCIWDSAYTDYDSAAAGYKDGKGDVLAELSAACTKYGLEMGLYLSPWDIHDDSYGYKDANGNNLVGSNGQPLNGMTWEQVYELDAKDYNEYYNNQLQEILGNPKYGSNGHFSEVWMDGAKGSGASVQNYDFNLWFNTIQNNEGRAAGFDADCMLFGAESYTGVRWIGNENGYAHKNTWSKSITNRENNTIDSNSSGGFTRGWENGNQWTVPEADARITSGWFWGTRKNTPKTIADLGGMYFGSVGNNATFLLNIPPNNQGTLDEAIIARVGEFGEAIRQTFDENMAADAAASVRADSVRGNALAYSPAHLTDGSDETVWAPEEGKNSASVLIDLGKTRAFDVVSIEEAIQYGQRINSWKVEARNGNGEWKTLDEGETIGAHKLVRVGSLRADQVRITVSVPEGKVPVLSQVGVYKASKGFELTSAAPDGMDVLDIESGSFSFTGTWHSESGSQYVNGTNRYANPGATATLSFHGTRAWLIGTLDPNHGTADIYVDDEFVETINMTASPRRVGAQLFDTGDLADGDHTIRVETKTKATGLEAAYTINNGGKGMVGIESAEYLMNEDETMNVKLVRYGAGDAAASVTLSPNPGSAIQDDFDTELITTVEFAPGETEKTAPVRTRRNTNATGNREFSIELSSNDPDLILGFNDRAVVEINDSENMTAALLMELVSQAEAMDANVLDGDWQTLKDAITDAKQTAGNADASTAQIQSAYDALTQAMEGFVLRGAFSAQSPFVFPDKAGQSTTLEAELSTLTNMALASDGQWDLRISEADWASQGKFVNCFNQQDIVEIPYRAAHAGTYQATVYYRSGDPKNNLVWHEPDGKIASGSVVAGAGDSAQATHSVTFTVEITEPGDGVWTFVGPDDKSPQLDRFVIEPVELVKDSFEVTTIAHEGGTISEGGTVEEGAGFDCTITPDAGYEIADVLVNGQSVGAKSSVHLDAVNENTTIEASFRFVHYSPAHRFVFPAASGTLEAEEMELHNTGTNEAWPMQISSGSWCGNGKFLNAMNTNDTVTLYYNAPRAGSYTVTLTFRSGDSRNGFTWSEADGKIESGSVQAGANDSAKATHTATFTWNVLEAGEGALTLTAFEKNAPQMDRFDLVWNTDTSALSAALERAQAILDAPESWSAASIAALQAAVDQAAALLEGTPDQDAVDAAVSAVEAAIAALEQAPTEQADKRLLQMAVEYANSVEIPEHVNALVRQAFDAALANAQSVLADASASQSTVNEAWSRLAQAIHMLDFTSDKTGLEALIAQAQAIDLSQYEQDEASEAFVLALENAKAVLADPAALDEQSIAQAIRTLSDAMAGLHAKTPEDIDTSLLAFLVESVSGIDQESYLPDSLAEFNEALAQARGVLADPQSQARVNSAADRLSQAWLNLRLKADESLLEALRDFAAYARSYDYSVLDASLQKEIKLFADKVDAAIASESLDQDAAASMASQAASYRSLMEQASARQNPSSARPAAAGNSAASAKSVKTAAASHLSFFAGMSAAAAGVLALLRRRNRK